MNQFRASFFIISFIHLLTKKKIHEKDKLKKNENKIPYKIKIIKLRIAYNIQIRYCRIILKTI